MQQHAIKGGGGLSLHVREWGERGNPAVLFIHGWSQSHQSWERQFNSDLVENYHLVALDNRGHGMSDRPLEPERYIDSKLWADDIAAIIDALDLDRPVLAGWSYGGLIISDYVRVHGQDKIAGINYAGGATVLNESAFGTLIGPGFLNNFEGATSNDLPTSIEAMKTFLNACFEIPLCEDNFRTVLAYNMMVPSAVRLNLGSRTLDNTDILRQLRIPVLVTHGDKDVVVLPAAGEYIAEHCQTAQTSWYEGIGHAPFIEDAARYNREIAAFIDSCQS